MTEKRSGRGGRIVLGLLLVAIVTVAGGALVLRAILTPERLRAETVKRASDATGLAVDLERAGLSFVPFGVEIEKLRIASPRAGDPPLLRLESGMVRLNLRALLGRNVVIERIELAQPVLSMPAAPAEAAATPAAEGAASAKGAARPSTTPGIGARAGASIAAGLRGEIDRLEIQDGTVRLFTPDGSGDVELRGVRLQAHVEATAGAGEIRADGTLELLALDVAALAPYREALDALKPKAAFAVTFRPADGSLQLHELRLDTATLGEGAFVVTGMLDRVDRPGETTFDVHAVADVDLARATKAGFAPPGVELAGLVRADLGAKGAAADPKAAAVSGEVTLSGLGVRGGDLAVPVTDGSGRAAMAGPDVEISGVSITAGRTRVTGTGRVANVFTEPHVSFRGSSPRLDLAEWAPDPAAAAGAPASGAGRAGAVQGGVADGPPPLIPPLPPFRADVILDADSLVTADAAMAGASFQASVKGGEANVNGTVKSGTFGEGIRMRDLAANVTLRGQTMRGAFRSPVVEAHRIPLTDVKGTLDLREDRILRFQDVTATVYTGRIQGKADVDLTDPAAPAFRIETQAAELQANDFLSALTPAHDFLFGRLDIASTFSGRGLTPDAIAKSLTGDGQVTAREGKLNRGPQTDAIWNALQLGDREAIPFRDMVTAFQVRDGRLITPDLVLGGKDANWKAKGDVAFDGKMNYAVEVELSGELSKRFAERFGSGVGSLLEGDAGRIALNLDVGGTVRDPKVKLDRDAITKRIAQKAAQELEKSLDKNKEKLGDALKKLIGGGK